MAHVRKKTAAQWAEENITLRVGEEGMESDTKKSKVGDGLTPWRNLSYQFNKAMADALYISKASSHLALVEDPTDPGTFIIKST